MDNLINHNKVTYVCYSREEAPTTGTPHLQCYIQYDGRKELSTARRVLATRGLNRAANFEVCRGSSDDNRNYCSGECEKKGNELNPTFVEFGEIFVIQGKRERGECEYESLAKRMKDGDFDSISDVAFEYPKLYMKHHGAIDKMFIMSLKKPMVVFSGPFRWNVTHDWNTSLLLWGESGIGKTCYAKYLLPNSLFVSHIDQLKSYSSAKYNGIIFDDMSFAHLPREAQIHLLDIDNERTIHVRYGHALIPANTKKLFLSNYNNIFLDDPAINRRLTKINLN